MSSRTALFLIGRLLLGGFFLYSGITAHVLQFASTTQYAASKGVPFPALAVAVAGALLLIGGVSLMLGVAPKVGILALVLFFVPVTLMMHHFWTVTDPQQRMIQHLFFNRNVALLGAALTLLIVPEPWPASLARRERTTRAARTHRHAVA